MKQTTLLLSADDRTGALEVGGLVASADTGVPVGPAARDDRCCVVDIGTRHLTPDEARVRMRELVARPAVHRSHKMDAGLRGNWAHEVAVLLDAGYRVAVICAFPDAGRRCKDGVVYIHDRPVLESVFGQDPLNAPISSKPADVLEAAGVRGDVVVWDANDNTQMHESVARAIETGRVVVGASGALGEVASQLLGVTRQQRIEVPKPSIVLCGSLNPLSRAQLEPLGAPVQRIGGPLALTPPVTVFATPDPDGPIDDVAAARMAAQAAEAVESYWPSMASLLILGGDTVAAVVGNQTLIALGMVAPGIPAVRFRDTVVVTKGGGIGQPQTLNELLNGRRKV